MGFFDSIGNLFGGAPNNSGFQAQGISQDQLNASLNQNNQAYQQQQALANSLMSQGQQGMGSQNFLSQALQAQAMGLGPNPAAQALANQTGNNISAQGALMAGQRGASANPALIARQIAEQGANTQQQAVGQGALMQAQQQLAAQQQLQNLAANQIGQQSGAVGNLNQYALQNQGQLLGANAQQNATNQSMAGINSQLTAKALGGVFNAAGGALNMPGAGGGGGGAAAAGGASPMLMAYDGGEVPDHINHMATLYHGNHYEHKESPKLAKVPESKRFEDGGTVPGKPEVKHNDIKNDKVPVMLTPKEIVLPLSVTQAKNPGEAAKAFVEAQLRKHGDSDGEHEDFKMALKEAIKARKKK